VSSRNITLAGPFFALQKLLYFCHKIKSLT
jgi:hypothetical protein